MSLEFEGRSSHVAPFYTKDLRGQKVNVDQNGHIQLNTRDDAVKQVKTLGQHLNCVFEGQEVAVVRIEHGAYVFAADVMREMKSVTIFDVSIRFENGELQVCRHCFDGAALRGRPVIILDGLLRTGKTMRAARDLVMEYYSLDSYGEEIVLCTMCEVDMGEERTAIRPDIAAFQVDDGHIYGYGLHFRQTGRQHRHLMMVPRLKILG